MANTINPKENTQTNSPTILTVVVQDSKSQPISNAKVSISPSGESGVTNSAGEFQFKLGNHLKYDIKASNGSDTATVPYYVTKGGATRIVINPTYVKAVEERLHPSILSKNQVYLIGAGLAVLIVAIFVWKFSKRKKRK